jgi:RNA polymerase sigma-70 factor (TIGR02943 family)
MNSQLIVIKEELIQCIEKYTNELYTWAYHKISDKENAEDIVQETFFSAFKNIESFNSESSMKTWLFRILNNKIIDYYRKNAKHNIHLESSFTFDERNDIFDKSQSWKSRKIEEGWEDQNLLDQNDFVEALDNCYEKLPANWKFAIQSKYIFQKEATEICQELDITPSNYWKIIQRAKLTLKECIELNWFNK